jgi:hypothetical protein
VNPIKEHTIYKLSVVVLALALLAPTFVKFSHVFEVHSTHVVCKNPQKTHFHKFNLDCEFCKFKLNTQWFFDTNSYQLVNQHEHYQVTSLHYSYLCNYLPLAFLLRGPPQMI